MKNKAPLPLMEQLIMVLVFALASALCLRGFAVANRTSRLQEARNQAVVIAQNTAELLKYTAGDYETVSARYNGTWDGHTVTICYDEAPQSIQDTDRSSYIVQIIPVKAEQELLGQALIQVLAQEDVLFEITVAWQEVFTDDIQ